MSDQVKRRLGVSTGDLADATGLSAEFFRQEIEAGNLRAARFGRVYVVPMAEASRYLEEKKFPVPGGWAQL